MSSTTARPALPVWRTVAEAFASAPANFLALLRIFWAWIVIFLASMAMMLGVWTLTWRPPPSTPPISVFIGSYLLLCAVVLTGVSSTAVAWHRLLLLGEQPPPLYFRVRGQVPRYIRRLLAIILIVGAVQLFCAALLWSFGVRVAPPGPDASPSGEHVIAQILVGLIMAIVGTLIATRLSVSLPGIAVDRPMTLNESWDLTRRNAWQLCGGTLLVYAPSYVLSFLLGLSAAIGDILAALLLVFATFFSTIATISFLSLSYRFFTGAPQP